MVSEKEKELKKLLIIVLTVENVYMNNFYVYD